MLSAGVNDRLAGSYPFLSMAAVVTCGWLMARQGRIAGEMQAKGEGDLAFLKAKQVMARHYLDHLVPEALGLKAQAMAGAGLFYELSADRKSTRLNPVTNAHLVCRLLLEKQKKKK